MTRAMVLTWIAGANLVLTLVAGAGALAVWTRAGDLSVQVTQLAQVVP